MRTIPGFLQADEATAGAGEVLQNAQAAVPITDISPEALLDTATPLNSQPAVQGTLETEQQHAAVYIPDSTASDSDIIPAVHSQARLNGQDASVGATAKKSSPSSRSAKSGKAVNC